MDKKTLTMVAGWLLVLGGINSGLMGLLNLELLEMVFGDDSFVERIVDIAIGASAVYLAYTMVGSKKK